MEGTFYVSKSFRYEKGNKNCGCHHTFRFEKGDALHIAGAPFYVDHMGWYVPVQKNDEVRLPMSADFIDELYEKKAIQTNLDVRLAINYHQFKVNQALDLQEKEMFSFHSKALNDWTDLCPEERRLNETWQTS
ncbi:hypothetical protein EQV77_09550 [Halobacillus fulvus]|nr:hypothetical protein EQV77_09550 [Halobacillus fulvus]